MEEYIIKEGKKLRLGYTTGSCAAAAAKAAAMLLLSGKAPESISLLTPKGIPLELAVQDPSLGDGKASCAIEKDSGDDPDVTKGTLIYAEVSFSGESGITIDGGKGVGRVTKPGLDQPVGAAAINSVPRRMIRENVEEVCRLWDHQGGLSVIISAPDGEKLAKKTFNPRIGIVGGISILGTSGIVEPMSEQALVDTIGVELKQRRASGKKTALLTPGNYGADFIRDGLGLDPEKAVQCSNYIGDALDICRDCGFQSILLVGHIGKMVKLGGGMLNTHSKYGDCRMEILAANAAACGLSPEAAEEILQAVACDEALRILQQQGILQATLRRLTRRITFHLSQRAGEGISVGVLLFSKEYGLLAQNEQAQQVLNQIKEEEKWYIL